MFTPHLKEFSFLSYFLLFFLSSPQSHEQLDSVFGPLYHLTRTGYCHLIPDEDQEARKVQIWSTQIRIKQHTTVWELNLLNSFS